MTDEEVKAPVPAHRRFRLRRRRKRWSDEHRLKVYTLWIMLTGLAMAWVAPILGLDVDKLSGEPTWLLLTEINGWVVPALPFWFAGMGVFTVSYVIVVRAIVAGSDYDRHLLVSGLIALALSLIGVGWTAGPMVAWLGLVAVRYPLHKVLLVSLVALPLASIRSDGTISLIVFLNVWLALTIVWANRFQVWLWKVVKAANEGRDAQARLAVTEERLRFARDMHDLVGHSLSAIAVKTELAGKLATRDAERAAAEMGEVHGLAREALREIRMAVRGYRTVELGDELRSVRSVLEAASIRCTLELPDADLPDELNTLLAWLVREGTTNVLRHSEATRCRITVGMEGDKVVLEMTNDGASVRQPNDRQGSGLAGMTERTAALGGSLTAGPVVSGGFLLRAVVPVEGIS
ncbi:sensor histidine kinase [Sinosporangium siamense]|uniref:Two-component sensor histidine kinase n=1 Tax=Sinosporangium siamense TaxID=1367973 RepID=A0A919REE6_9ACTN|nr:sensor histidine kinase [Sinosporangium siamense]GII91280.1 two-component sensor histidine kinase [Sinosporangium siamense]